MENKVLFKGIYPALISPVDENGKIKVKELRELLRWESSFGVNGYYLCGSTGEGFLLKAEERKKLLETVLEEVGDKLDVIANTGAVDLPTTIELTKHAHNLKADAVSSVPPIYYIYGENEIFDYYKTLAEVAEGTPLLLYVYGSNGSLSIEMIKRLMNIDNVIGLKWTNPNYYAMHQMKNINNGNINVINGPDETLISGLVEGADAGIGTTYNIMPGLFVDLYKNFKSGNIEKAMQIQRAITSVITIMIEHHAIASTKAMLNAIGHNVGQCIKPLRQIDLNERKLIMEQAQKFIDFEQQTLRH